MSAEGNPLIAELQSAGEQLFEFLEHGALCPAFSVESAECDCGLKAAHTRFLSAVRPIVRQLGEAGNG